MVLESSLLPDYVLVCGRGHCLLIAKWTCTALHGVVLMKLLRHVFVHILY